MGELDIIHCIGDSHASFFSGYDSIQPTYPEPSSNRYPFFKGYRLGPVLAYSLVNLNSTAQGRERLFELAGQLPAGSRILMCFGEIDCRCHLLKQAHLQNKPVDEIIEACVTRYFQVLDELAAMGFKVMVWNVIPSADSFNIEFPTYGSMVERNQCSIRFNTALKRECVKRGMTFLSIFDRLIRKDLTSKTSYFFDGIHLGQTAMPFVIREVYKVAPDLIKSHYSKYYIQLRIVIAGCRRIFRSAGRHLTFGRLKGAIRKMAITNKKLSKTY